MPGTLVLKPIEANLTHSTEWFRKMDPYLSFTVGDKRFNSSVCKHGGKHPSWTDSLAVPVSNQSQIVVELIDKDSLSTDDHIGSFVLDLKEVETRGKLNKWYPLYYKNQQAGEVHVESFFERPLTSQSHYPEKTCEQGGNVYIEQWQTVEPHKFLKEVDIVETRPIDQEIEVLEPHKVLKEFKYTDVVPVVKHIETIEPRLVEKDIEVIEPRLVTKQIQVIENVPVMKHVEVVEPVAVMKDIETYEPKTFSKTIEVVEQVPVKKHVTVTQPYTMKKPVEYVEPIITTKTITKETHPDTIVHEDISQEVGPASLAEYENQKIYSVQDVQKRAGYIPPQTEQLNFEFDQMNLGGQSKKGYSSLQKPEVLAESYQSSSKGHQSNILESSQKFL